MKSRRAGTGVVLRTYTHQQFRSHLTGAGHPEAPARLGSALQGVERAGLSSTLLTETPLHPETSRIIGKVHSPEYAKRFAAACERGEPIFQTWDNPISALSYEAAVASVGTALTAAADIWESGSVDRGFVIARPPGHHARAREAMGFCFFNTIACVAERLLELSGIERVLIFDMDVHHGNGTQELFEERDDVYFVSMHRYPFYPGTGAAREIGRGRGAGFTRNIPLEADTGDAAYLAAVENVVVPILSDYAPQAILISAGFDAHERDPLGGMRVSEEAFGEMTRRIVEASQSSSGRVLSLLEGGYDPLGLELGVAEHLHALSEGAV